ncbi:MAG: hypothetical protein JF627_08625 [Alphaproteobacteria bacterium]|nr:hypothetical protein [Alphaproteobacteria bacterium]
MVPAQAETSWKIAKTEWSGADEKGFGLFLKAIAESGCKTSVECLRGPWNPYRASDPASFEFHADCAKWVYMLRAYYASKHGLPFSYVSKISGEGEDLRFSKTSNHALSRRDLVDRGKGIGANAELKNIRVQVWTATYRMDPAAETPVLQDFYSPKLQRGSIRPGTAIYDTNGHVVIVYEVTEDGRVLYVDAHPDESVTRGVYGPQIPPGTTQLGGGFKNFRPMKLVGAVPQADGSLRGGRVVLARNDEIADYSLEQYYGHLGNGNGDGSKAKFSYDNAEVDLFQYVKASLTAKSAPAPTNTIRTLVGTGK